MATPLRSKSILCVGEVSWDQRWLVDHLPGTVIDCFAKNVTGGPGGCALNSAMGIASIGLPVELLGNNIDDSLYGPQIFTKLTERGVVSHLLSSASSETPFCQVFVETLSGNRCFALNHKDIEQFDELSTLRLAERTARGDFSVVFVQCYPRPLAAAFLGNAHFPVEVFALTQDIEPEDPLVPAFDLVQISRDEATTLSNDQLQALGARYFRGRCRYLILTQGLRGSFLVSPLEPVAYFPAVKVLCPVDSTGCGDAFRAGLMAGLAKGQSLPEALASASQAGAAKVLVVGSYL